MEKTEKIYLSIYGNPIRDEGARTLTDGFTPFSLGYEDYPGVSGSSYYFVLKIDRTHTLYKLVCNRVTTSDAKEGTLIFGMSVPKGWQLKAGKSPYDLLLKIRSFFQINYMTPTVGATLADSYTFGRFDKIDDSKCFDSIIEEFPIEKCPQYKQHCLMTGTDVAALQLSEDNMRNLFCDPHYPDFKCYKEIVVAEKIDPAYYSGGRNLSGLNIPRRYAIKISNGKIPMKVTLRKENGGQSEINNICDVEIEEKDFGATITLESTKDSKYYNNKSITFSVNELLNVGKRDSIEWNPESGMIACDVYASEKQELFKLSLEVDGKSLFYQDFKDKFSLKLNNEEVKITDVGYPLVKGEQLKFSAEKKYWTVELHDESYELDSVTVAEKNEKAKQKELRISLRKKNRGIRFGGEIDSGGVNPKASKKLTLQVNIPYDVFTEIVEESEPLWVEVVEKSSGALYGRLSEFSIEYDKKRKPVSAYINLPLDFDDFKGKMIVVKVRGEKKYLISRELRLQGIANKDQVSFSSDDIKSNYPFKKLAQFYNLVIVTPLLIIAIGVLTYFLCTANSGEGQPNDNVVSELKEENANLRKDISDKKAEIEDLKEQLKNVTSKGAGSEPKTETETGSGSGSEDAVTAADAEIAQLLSGDPKFADVLTLYSRLSADRTVWNKLANKQKLSAYYKVCNTLLNGNFDAIKAIMNPRNSIYNGLSEQHKWDVLSIGYGLENGKIWADGNSGDGKHGVDGGITLYINDRGERKYSTFSKVFNAFRYKRNITSEEL